MAENLLNLKKNEIVLIENNYNTKISFDFSSQYSLHDPIVEVEINNSNFKDEKIKLIKKNNKEKKLKKTIIKKKIKTKKTSDKSIKKIDTSSNEKENLDVNSTDNSEDNIEEKTGWWS